MTGAAGKQDVLEGYRGHPDRILQFKRCRDWIKMAYDYRSRSVVGRRHKTIDEHLVSQELASAFSEILPSNPAFPLRLMHQRSFEVSKLSPDEHTQNASKADSEEKGEESRDDDVYESTLLSDPDIILERVPCQFTNLTCYPNTFYWHIEVKKSLSPAEHKYSVMQMLQACTFGLNDTAIQGDGVRIGRISLGILVHDKGMDVYGVCDGCSALDQQQRQVFVSTCWCPLATVSWDDDDIEIVFDVFDCMTWFLDEINSTYYAVVSPFHPMSTPELCDDVVLSEWTPKIDDSQVTLTATATIVRTKESFDVKAAMPLQVMQRELMHTEIRRCDDNTNVVYYGGVRPSTANLFENTVIVNIKSKRVNKIYDYYCGYHSVHPMSSPSDKMTDSMKHCSRWLILENEKCVSYRRQPNIEIMCDVAMHDTTPESEAYKFAMSIKIDERLSISSDRYDVVVVSYDMYGYVSCSIPDSLSDVVLIKKLNKIKRDLEYLHVHCGYVHGDVRPVNIIFGNANDCDAWLVDYDYARPGGDDAHYPPHYRNNSIIPCRHVEAKSNNTMMPEHDMHAIDYLLDVHRNRPDEIRRRLREDAAGDRVTGTPVKVVTHRSVR